MWSILIGFGCTVAGLIFGKYLDKGYDTKRWVRDERAQAYVSYVNAFQELRQILRRLATLQRIDPEGWEAARHERRKHWSTYNAALVKVELYGSGAVYEAVLAADTALRVLSVEVTKGLMTVEQWHEQRRPVDREMRTCVDRVRRELNLEALPSRSQWVENAPSASEPALPSG